MANNKVYYIAVKVELPKKGKVTVTRTIYTPSQHQNIKGVESSKVDMERIKRELKADKFKIIEVEPIRILSE